MELLSFQAVILLLIAVIASRVLPKKVSDVVLAALTLWVLFVSNDLKYFVLTLVVLVFVFASGLYVKKHAGEKRTKVMAYTTVIILVLGLCGFKYANFFIDNINRVAKLVLHHSVLHSVHYGAPFGTSYGILILIAYILGVYWGTMDPRKNIFSYIHTVAFFPLWVMGPILGVEDMRQEEKIRVTYHSLTFGLQRILWGVFKKLVISERCAVVVNTIFADPNTYSGLYVFLGALLFVVQLYTDFSGAMDMVIGAAEIIGKKLPENFDRPFSSKTVAEFWRRWHITLGAWLKNYVLYPLLKSRLFQWMGGKFKKKLGKKKGKRLVTYCGLFVSWFLIGLWHGGGWNYIFGSGIYYWILIVGSEVLTPVFDKIVAFFHINRECAGYRFFQCARTTLFFSFGMLFFRSGSLHTAITELKALGHVFNPWIFVDGSLAKLGLDVKDIIVGVVAMFILLLVSQLEKNHGGGRAWVAQQNVVFRWVIWLGLIFAILIFGMYGANYDAASFIYQGF